MKKTAFVFGLVTLLCHLSSSEHLFGQDVKAADPTKEPEFKTIFNGTDLTDWSGDPRLWSVKDGVIHGETTREKVANGNTFLIWQGGKVADFELELEFRCNATNNSGIQYRSKHITEKVKNDWVVRGYQHELRNEHKFPNVAGFIYDEGGKRGRVSATGEKSTSLPNGEKKPVETLITEADYQKLFKLDEWNKVRIVAKGNHIQHFMNDKLIMDHTEADPELLLSEGVLALQLHAGAPMWAEFKNIRIRQFEGAK